MMQGKDEEGEAMEGSFASGKPGPDSGGMPAEAVQRVRARELLGSRGIVQIEHRGEIYTLRITKNDRLILTK